MPGYYDERSTDLNKQLRVAVPVEMRRKLHRAQPWKHFLIVIQQTVLLIGLPFAIYTLPHPYQWVPCSILLGFIVFSYSVLLHEAVHHAIFAKRRPKLNAVLGFIYGLVSGLSATQFTKWHLDHHAELGSTSADPKRAYLSPKKNTRWLKMLYFTPFLFPIYFRAAAKGQSTYNADLRNRIKMERLVVTLLHLMVLGFFFFLSPLFAVKAYIIPVFFVFPVAFALNRLGQHYVIQPDNIAAWGTLVKPNFIWNFLFLFSSYHLEHHYFPSIPFYNLKQTQNALSNFYKKQHIRSYGYIQLLHLWFIRNHKPHS